MRYAYSESAAASLGKGQLQSKLRLDIVSGTVHCLKLSNDQLLITDGTFDMFKDDMSNLNLSIMTYRFTAVTSSGKEYQMVGTKTIGPSVTFSVPKLWRATTTLRLVIQSKEHHVVGSGTLRLGVRSFIGQLRTLTTSGSTIIGRRRLLVQFLNTFTGRLLKMFLSPLAPLCYPEDTNEDPRHLSRKAPPSVENKIKATDGVTSTLRTWAPTTPTSGHAVQDVLFIPGAAVSHLIFASPYIQQNAIEHFTQKGYRCWCLTTRFGLQQLHEQGPRHANS